MSLHSRMNKVWVWSAKCDCGNNTLVRVNHLSNGHTISCGCIQFAHRMCGTAEYRTWTAIHQRCENATLPKFKNYGGRGIKVCDRWRTFTPFFQDMGLRPSAAHSIDRIDNNGNYCPENCRWATATQQQRNRRTNHLVEFKEDVKPLIQWCEELGLKYDPTLLRLRKGWSAERAFSEPLRVTSYRGSHDA